MGERMKAEDYIKESKTSEKSNYFYSLIKRVLLTITMVLIVLISCNLNKEFKDTIKKYVYETNYNFAKINSIYKKYMLEFKKETDKVTKLVSKNDDLNSKKTREYKDGVLINVGKEYPIKMLSSGLVSYIGEQDGMNIVVVQQSNGIDVIYGNISSQNIKIYDYIEKDMIIGVTSEEELYLSFQKNGEILNYEPYIKY